MGDDGRAFGEEVLLGFPAGFGLVLPSEIVGIGVGVRVCTVDGRDGSGRIRGGGTDGVEADLEDALDNGGGVDSRFASD
jgi:hypothetical protein